MKLFRVCLDVRLLAWHPLYHEAQCGLLNVWLFAPSPERAAEAARRIVKELPYELRAPLDQVTDTPSALPEYQQCERAARQMGVALFLAALRAGVPEPPPMIEEG
ncbi:MAG: hypothetical protein NTY01_05560 [Verrucomicrobia bacterium]|nr:hypothetical protein [Verrucomicrobiota bacterium]